MKSVSGLMIFDLSLRFGIFFPGECDAVRCELQWSAWSATCGLATRKLRNVEIPIKVKQESCDNVKKTCEKIEETQTDDFFCKFVVHFVGKDLVRHRSN